MSSAPNFDYVMKNKLCLGCGACTQGSAASKLTMTLSVDGYLRPRLKEELTRSEDLEFSKLCPGLEVKHKSKDEYWTELWGPVHSSHVGWSTDSEIRHGASSGGGITSTLCYLLDQNLVDAVLHIGVSSSDPLRNEWVISVDSEQAKSRSGSRYAPAAPLMGLNEVMSQHPRIAIVGKPCDIVAARKLASEFASVDRAIKYYISFMCAGVPSYSGTDAVITKLGTTPSEVTYFRYRGNGWPGYATAIDQAGQSFQMSYQESWGRILNKHLQLRCKICVDGTGEFADITFADAWHGGDEGYPLFEEQAGRSLILARSDRGVELLNGAVSHGYIEREPLDLGEVIKMQPYQAIRKKLLLSRVVAMRLFGLQPPRYDIRNMFKLSLTAGLKPNAVSFLGMAKRTFALSRRHARSK